MRHSGRPGGPCPAAGVTLQLAGLSYGVAAALNGGLMSGIQYADRVRELRPEATVYLVWQPAREFVADRQDQELASRTSWLTVGVYLP